MKLLLDQNLSRRIVTQLSQAYPETTQVSLLDMAESTDKEIWDYAQLHEYAVVTLDADFHEYSLLWGGPPLVVWLRCGNQPSNVVLQKLLQSQPAIEQAHRDVDIWCIEVH